MVKEKVRVNITVDSDLLRKARKKLDLFGGKLSTLFNAYLSDFVRSIDKQVGSDYDLLLEKVKDIDLRLKKVEKK